MHDRRNKAPSPARHHEREPLESREPHLRRCEFSYQQAEQRKHLFSDQAPDDCRSCSPSHLSNALTQSEGASMPTERCCLEAACSRPGYFASITGMDCYPEVQRLPPKACLTLSLLHASSK